MRTKALVILILIVNSAILAQSTRISANKSIVCVDDTVNFWWSPSNNTTISWNFGVDANPAIVTGTGLHRITYSSHGVKTITASVTSGGTTSTDTLRITVSQLLSSYIDTVYSFHPSATYVLNASARVNNPISVAPYRYQWTINGTTSSLDTANHQYTYKFTRPGNHLVRLRVHDAGGCVDSIDKIVRTDSIFSAPNVFTPNNDGKNETFIIRSTGLIPFSMEIYDRWGSVVYKPNLVGTQLIWDGRNSAGTLVQPGVYFYVVTPQDSGIEPLKGFVHVFYGKNK